MTLRRVLRVHGTVQGVGFRPFVYGLAHDLGLSGHVLDDGRGVSVDLQGPEASLERFAARLVGELEPCGWVERLEPIPAPVEPGRAGFTLRSRRSLRRVAGERRPRTC